jgi:hypothetical protein
MHPSPFSNIGFLKGVFWQTHIRCQASMLSLWPLTTFCVSACTRAASLSNMIAGIVKGSLWGECTWGGMGWLWRQCMVWNNVMMGNPIWMSYMDALPIHLCDVWHCIAVNKALTQDTAVQHGPSASPPLSHWDPPRVRKGPRPSSNLYQTHDSISDIISERFCATICEMFCDIFKLFRLYPRSTSRPTPFHHQIHLTMCMYMHRSFLYIHKLYIYIYIFT